MMNKEISGVQFIRQCVDQKKDFIALAMTPWHAISVDASIAYLCSINQSDLSGEVMVEEHPENGICVSDVNFNKIGYSVYYPSPIGESSEGKKNLYRKFGQILHNRWEHMCFYLYVFFGGINWFRYPVMYVVAPVFPRAQLGLSLFRLKRFAKFITCDEGVGSYMFFEEEKPTTKSIRDWISYFRRIVVGHHWMIKFHKIIPTTLFLKKNDKLQPNTYVLPYYKKVLKGREKFSLPQTQINFENSVILCTSVREGDNFLDNADVNLWSSISQVLIEDGERLIMKPHPRDTIFSSYSENWHCKLFQDPKVSMEAICANAHPKCIIGFGSTALVTASLFYNIPVICITEMLDLNKRNMEFVRGFQLYKKLFGDIIYFPVSLTELREYIKTL